MGNATWLMLANDPRLGKSVNDSFFKFIYFLVTVFVLKFNHQHHYLNNKLSEEKTTSDISSVKLKSATVNHHHFFHHNTTLFFSIETLLSAN